MKALKRILKRSGAILLVGIMLFTSSTTVYADSKEEAEKKKEEAEQKKKDAEQIIENLESLKSDVVNYVKELDNQVAIKQAEIDELIAKENELQEEIVQKQAELEEAKQIEQQQYQDMKARVKFMYENGNTSYMEAFLNATEMSDILNRAEYVSKVSEYDTKQLKKYMETRQLIADTEAKLQVDLQACTDLEAEVTASKEALEVLIDDKSAEIEAYNESIQSQEALAAQYEADIKAQENLIAQIEEEERKRNEQPDGPNPYVGGPLMWPVPSSHRITSYFGYRTPDGGYVNANHNGLDIGAPMGAPVVAAASGTVVIARYSNSAGNWVTINHGNGLYTVYMHASALNVSEGQYVNAGDTIMFVGSTGWSTGPHLHFGVRNNGVYVDPLTYLGG